MSLATVLGYLFFEIEKRKKSRGKISFHGNFKFKIPTRSPQQNSQCSPEMDTQLLDLPQVCLEEIFRKLRFAEISRLGATCRYFREIAKTIFRLYFKNLEETIEQEMEKIEAEANKPDSLTIPEHLHLALLHSVLRILLSEAKMLKAHCWRYMREPSYDFCFPAGLILDEFERIMRSVRNKSLKKGMEPEITTTLFHLGETFYDYFDFNIETYFKESSALEVKITSTTNRQTFLPNIYSFVSNITREALLRDIHRCIRKRTPSCDLTTLMNHQPLTEEKSSLSQGQTSQENHDVTSRTLFGVKIVDILNCCALSNFRTLLSHGIENSGYRLQTHYELRDINVLEALPTNGLSVATSETQLNKICRYIRNNVRWTNLFHPLQDLWMLEDAIEINRNTETALALLRQYKLQRTSSRLYLNNPDQNNIFQYDHRKIISRFKNCFGLVVTANLECPTLHNIPLKIDKCLGSKCFVFDEPQTQPDCNVQFDFPFDKLSNKNTIQPIDVEKWNCNIKTYKFHLELKIQYPSFLSETIREAILKVDQIGEETIVSTDGDDMRKSATYRADDNYD